LSWKHTQNAEELVGTRFFETMIDGVARTVNFFSNYVPIRVVMTVQTSCCRAVRPYVSTDAFNYRIPFCYRKIVKNDVHEKIQRLSVESKNFRHFRSSTAQPTNSRWEASLTGLPNLNPLDISGFESEFAEVRHVCAHIPRWIFCRL
jgi:hypothetical protein